MSFKQRLSFLHGYRDTEDLSLVGRFIPGSRSRDRRHMSRFEVGNLDE